MEKVQENKKETAVDRLASESGLAISIMDSAEREISVSNNNSICRNLNPGPGFSPECARYCGAAYDKATQSGKVLRYQCHAGLECRALPFTAGGRPLVAIIGRAFVNAEEYRKATERAIAGDWRNQPPNEFFANVLLSASGRIFNDAVRKFRDMASRAMASTVDRKNGNEPEPEIEASDPTGSAQIAPQKPAEVVGGDSGERNGGEPRDRSAEIAEWRSFFGSILNFDYAEASAAILKFIAEQYRFESLVWLKKRGTRLENYSAYGKLKGRQVRIGIAADDRRLAKALSDGTPLELGERRNGKQAGEERKMNLFPMGVSGDVTAAIAVLDPTLSERSKQQIVRICRSIAPQLEILRLRGEVARGDTLATAVKKFSESLKRMDNEDLWVSLTQNAAEMLRAERSSLLIWDEDSGAFRIKAMLGAEMPKPGEEEIGGRVAKFVLSRKRAIAVADVAKAGLVSGGPERKYKTSSFLSSPITVGDRIIGVMNFADRAGGEAFDHTSLELFEAIAPQLAVAIDRAELKEKAGQFEQLSVTDALTGLLNRRYIEERLVEEIKRSTRHGYPMSFMMLDVDAFKAYNDSFGHPAGDEALKLVGYMVRETLRGADVAARFGGEEFSILLPQTTSEEARTIADRIRSNIEQTKFPHRRVTVSIGVASCSADVCLTADLISAADKALYEAKRIGRNRVVVFEDMKAQKARRTR